MPFGSYFSTNWDFGIHSANASNPSHIMHSLHAQQYLTLTFENCVVGSDQYGKFQTYVKPSHSSLSHSLTARGTQTWASFQRWQPRTTLPKLDLKGKLPIERYALESNGILESGRMIHRSSSMHAPQADVLFTIKPLNPWINIASSSFTVSSASMTIFSCSRPLRVAFPSVRFNLPSSIPPPQQSIKQPKASSPHPHVQPFSQSCWQ